MAESLQVFKVVGFIQYFFGITDARKRKHAAVAAREQFLDAGVSVGIKVLYKEARVDLQDSLIGESVMLLLYGISVALAGFVCEIITNWIASVISVFTILVSALK